MQKIVGESGENGFNTCYILLDQFFDKHFMVVMRRHADFSENALEIFFKLVTKNAKKCSETTGARQSSCHVRQKKRVNKSKINPYNNNVDEWIHSKNASMSNCTSYNSHVSFADDKSVIYTVSDTHQDTRTKEINKITGTYEITELSKVGHDIEGDDSDQDGDMTSESELSDFEIEYETDKDNSQSQRNCVISDSNSTFDNQIKKYIDDNFAALQLHIDGKLQIVLQMLAETQLILNHIQGRFEQVPVQDPSQPLHEVMKCIPIDSADKLQSLELNDPTSKNFLMLYMKKVGGTNGSEFVVRNLRKIFVD
ncbi:hypothetical protein RN001_006039 [Aquatica leii]|uniref:Uncharacterized protein n=1 Tax=Aquatica leii TaxID=1421715 RepID=A0AAN7SS64_9COLE|nr:hypothetical protein RN001_006039 [Aquatica leii]